MGGSTRRPQCMCVLKRQPGDRYQVLLGGPRTYQPPNALTSSLSQTPWAVLGYVVGGSFSDLTISEPVASLVALACPLPTPVLLREATAHGSLLTAQDSFPEWFWVQHPQFRFFPPGQSEGPTWGHHEDLKSTLYPSLGLLHLPVPPCTNLPRPAWASEFCCSRSPPWCPPAAAWTRSCPETGPWPRESGPAGSLALAPRLIPPHPSCGG